MVSMATMITNGLHGNHNGYLGNHDRLHNNKCKLVADWLGHYVNNTLIGQSDLQHLPIKINHVILHITQYDDVMHNSSQNLNIIPQT